MWVLESLPTLCNFNEKDQTKIMIYVSSNVWNVPYGSSRFVT